ncbi:MAG: Gfo/Idh/MocA family oxidoreductase, partial [Bacteroidota bacterium]
KACKEADVKLSVGYRLQSEPYTNEVKRFVKERTFGKPLYVSTEAAYISGNNWDQWRFNKALSGGGALVNMGVYAIQGALYATGELPATVTGQEFSTNPAKFKETDETITAQFEFPSGATANIFTSHNAKADRLYATCTNGWYELKPAFGYGPLAGNSSNGEISYPHKSQMALQMDDFALHIMKGTPNKAPGEMGLRDMKIVEAIYESIRLGKKISIDW